MHGPHLNITHNGSRTIEPLSLPTRNNSRICNHTIYKVEYSLLDKACCGRFDKRGAFNRRFLRDHFVAMMLFVEKNRNKQAAEHVHDGKQVPDDLPKHKLRSNHEGFRGQLRSCVRMLLLVTFCIRQLWVQ